MLQKFLYKTLMLFDRGYKYLYPNYKSDTIKSILTDHSQSEIDLQSFIDTRGLESLQEIYVILNGFYISKLSKLIAD